MPQTELDIRFHEAVEIASHMKQASLPQDVQLRLYAYYKQSTQGTTHALPTSAADLRNAFKTNAWMQISHLTSDEAKQCYIDIINSLK